MSELSKGNGTILDCHAKRTHEVPWTKDGLKEALFIVLKPIPEMVSYS